MADQRHVQIGTIFGEYQLLRRLGGGTFGTVYQAKHPRERSPVAIKILRAQLARREDFKDFINEARMMRLYHPHIVRMLDFGVSKEDIPYLVMEYASGGTLHHHYPRGTKLALPIVLAYTEQLAAALQCAHDQRIIHRDVKPENILVRGDGTLLLSDFGIAKVLESSSLISLPTALGTPAYMAPEQSSGKPCFASDQYALAVVVYEWITGERPFQGSMLEVAVQHRLDQPPALTNIVPDLPLAVEQIVLKALSKDPTERFATVLDFARALRTAMQTASFDAIPAQIASPAIQETRRKVPLVLKERSQQSEPQEPIVTGKAITRLPLQMEPPPERILSGITDPTRAPREHNQLLLAATAFPSVIKHRQLPRLVLLGVLALAIVSASIATFFTIHGLPQGHRIPKATAISQTTPSGTATIAAEAKPGSIWHAQSFDAPNNLEAVTWGDSQFVAVGASGVMLTSPDGRTWKIHQPLTVGDFSAVTWGDSQFVAVGSSGSSGNKGIILTSLDGHTWTPRQPSGIAGLAGVTWGDSQFVAVGDNGTILISPDGHTWTLQQPFSTDSLAGVTWGDSQFVAVGGNGQSGNNGIILTSPDGRTWTSRQSFPTDSLAAVTWGGSQFVAVGSRGNSGNDGITLTSPDGRTWTPRQSSTAGDFMTVTWGDSQFVAGGLNGIVLTSPDGRTWTLQHFPQVDAFTAVTWGDSQFVAVGSSGTIITSP